MSANNSGEPLHVTTRFCTVTNSNAHRPARPQVRGCALQLLACLLTPQAAATQRLLAKGWPDSGAKLLSLATDAEEPYAVRLAALHFLSAVMALPAKPRGGDDSSSHGAVAAAGYGGEGLDMSSLHKLGAATLLQVRRDERRRVRCAARPVELCACPAALAIHVLPATNF